MCEGVLCGASLAESGFAHGDVVAAVADRVPVRIPVSLWYAIQRAPSASVSKTAAAGALVAVKYPLCSFALRHADCAVRRGCKRITHRTTGADRQI
jgi:hypothetical protein